MSENLNTTTASDEENVREHEANNAKEDDDWFSSRAAGDHEQAYNNGKDIDSTNTSRNNEGIQKSQENNYNKQTNMYNIQSAMAAQDAMLRSGYDAMQAYYGWLPGIARFPAFFYPPPFIGFPQNMPMSNKNNTNNVNQDNDDEKRFCYEEENKAELSEPALHHHTTKNAESSRKQHSRRHNGGFPSKGGDSVSDIDEGMGSELNDFEASGGHLKRHRQSDEQKVYRQEGRRSAAVSVIQENCTIIKKKARRNNEDTKINEGGKDNNSDHDSAKRGRASTRQIAKTEQYWDRRKKNNVSAKKSRDARRQREAMINQHSAMLESESLRLRAEVAMLKEENERLKS